MALSAAGAYWTAVCMCVIERERERESRTRPFHTVALIKATMLFILLFSDFYTQRNKEKGTRCTANDVFVY